MSLSLLTELQQLSYAKKTESQIQITQSVDKFLGHLFTSLTHKQEATLTGLDVDTLAAQIAGLTVLGKVDSREAFDDFATEEGHGVSEKFFQFLDEIDERTAKGDFKDGANADEFLVYIGSTHAKSKTLEWKDVIEDAIGGNEEAIGKLKTTLGKLHTFYSGALTKLRAHFAKTDEDDIDSEFQL